MLQYIYALNFKQAFSEKAKHNTSFIWDYYIERVKNRTKGYGNTTYLVELNTYLGGEITWYVLVIYQELLIHPLDKMATIPADNNFRCIFFHVNYIIPILECNWNSFLGVQLTVLQHWFR